MECRGNVVSGFLRNGDKFLVGLRPLHKPAPDLLEFSGGKVDETDKSLEFALKREYKEETNLTVDVGKLLWDDVLTFPDGAWHIYMYEVTIVDGEPIANVHQWLRWLTWEEMQQYKMAPSLIRIMEQIINNDSNRTN